MIFAKFLKTPILKNIYERLLRLILYSLKIAEIVSHCVISCAHLICSKLKVYLIFPCFVHVFGTQLIPLACLYQAMSPMYQGIEYESCNRAEKKFFADTYLLVSN